MPEQTPSEYATTPIIVQLHEQLYRKGTSDVHATNALWVAIGNLLDVPGRPFTRIELAPRGDLPDGRWFRLFVNGAECHYPDELLDRAVCHAAGVPLGVVDASWLATADDDAVIETLTVACSEIIQLAPAVLLGPEQLLAYVAKMRASAEVPQPYAADALPIVVQQGVSLADTSRVAMMLALAQQEQLSAEDAAERIIAELAAKEITVLVPEPYLRELTTNASSTEGFSLMRDGLFYELGMRYPAFRFEAADSLADRRFAFRINNVVTLPRVGLAANERLVNARLADGRAALNPANLNDASIVAPERAKELEGSGYTTWDPFGYLILCCADELRRHSAQLLHSGIVREQLDQIENIFPALARAARAKFSDEHFTRVFRGLLAEGISIRNLRTILELVLDFDYVVVDGSTHIVFDDRLPTPHEPEDYWLRDPENLTAFIRTGLKRYISHLHTRGQSTLMVYLLDPDLERQAFYGAIDADEQKRLLAEVRHEVGRITASAPPAILTTVEARLAMRKLIGREFPRLPVLAYQELSPEMNIQPLGRISL